MSTEKPIKSDFKANLLALKRTLSMKAVRFLGVESERPDFGGERCECVRTRRCEAESARCKRVRAHEFRQTPSSLIKNNHSDGVSDERSRIYLEKRNDCIARAALRIGRSQSRRIFSQLLSSLARSEKLRRRTMGLTVVIQQSDDYVYNSRLSSVPRNALFLPLRCTRSRRLTRNGNTFSLLVVFAFLAK